MIFDAKKSGRELGKLLGHTAFVTSVAFCGKELLISASRDFSVIIWNSDLQPIQTITNCHNDWINSLAADPSSSSFFTASNDFTLKQWSLDNPATQMQLFQGHMGLVTSVANSANFVLSGSSDSVAKLWSRDGAEVTSLHGHSLRINAVDLSLKRDQKVQSPPKKKIIMLSIIKTTYRQLAATASDDGSVRVWDPFQGSLVRFANAHAHDGTAVCNVNSSGGAIASASMDGTVKLWSDASAARLQQQKHSNSLAGDGSTLKHAAPVTDVATDGHLLMASCARDGSVKVWQRFAPATGGRSAVCPVASFSLPAVCGPANAVVFLAASSPSAFVIAVGANDGSLTVWQGTVLRSALDKPASLMPVQVCTLAVNNSAITKLRAVATGSRLVVSSWDRSCTFFTWAGGELRSSLPSGKQTLQVLDEATVGLDVHFDEASQETTLVSASVKGVVTLAVVDKAGDVNATEEDQGKSCLDVVANLDEDSSCGNTIYCAFANGSLKAIEKDTGLTLADVWAHHGQASRVAIFNDGQDIVTGGGDATLYVHAWTSSSLTVVGAFHLAGPCTALAAHKSGDDIVAGDALGRLYWFTFKKH